MYLRKWSPVKYLMYLWLAILVWMFSRCDSVATMHLAPPPYHSSGYQGTPGGHSNSISSSISSISSSSSSSSGRYVSNSSRTTPSISSHTSKDGVHQVESLAGGAIPPRLYDASRAPTHPLPLLPLPSVATGKTSPNEVLQLLRRNSANTKSLAHQEQSGRHIPPNEPMNQSNPPSSTVVDGALSGTAGSPTDSSSIIGSSSYGTAEAERALQRQWTAQMRLKGERRRLHRRRWRTLANAASPLGSRNRRDSALSGTGGYGMRSSTAVGNQQHSVRPQRRNGTGGGAGGGQRRYCSARDPATLAFEAPVVCEAKVKSMSDRRPTFAATFEILTVHKQPPKGRLQRGRTVRLQFNLTTTNECDIFRGKFRERGFVREELELGKVYFLFLKPNMGYTNFTILGQPIRKTKRSEGGVLQGVNPNYGTRPVIHFITPNVTRLVGKRVRLVCKVSGHPPPKVAWFKDKRLINRNATKYAQVHLKKRSVLIFNASTADSGEYECRAKNRYNNSSVFNSTHVKITLPKATIPAVHMRACADSHRDDFCHNGGTCFSIDSIGEMGCHCVAGFSGFRCENKDSEIQSVPSNKQQDCTSQRYAGRLYTECMDFFVMDSPAPAMYEYDEEEN
ncbi:protein vein [Anopheles maculipalpis]|uniref:protein vein n=1 Tax=Anopheles maculipalpis TaxID=1496333 RepID=UPI002159A3BF|nr:protein vein [Anopheles maculipalpis]